MHHGSESLLMRRQKPETPYIELPDQLKLPSKVFRAALRLRQMSIDEGVEFGTYFARRGGLTRSGRIRRGDEEGIAYLTSPSTEPSPKGLPQIHVMRIHSHHPSTYDDAKKDIRENDPDGIIDDDYIDEIIAIRNAFRTVPSSDDIYNFLKSKASSSGIVSMNGIVVLVKNVPPPKTENIEGRAASYDVAQDYLSRLGLGDDIHLLLDLVSRVIAPFGTCYFTPDLSSPVLQKIVSSEDDIVGFDFSLFY